MPEGTQRQTAEALEFSRIFCTTLAIHTPRSNGAGRIIKKKEGRSKNSSLPPVGLTSIEVSIRQSGLGSPEIEKQKVKLPVKTDQDIRYQNPIHVVFKGPAMSHWSVSALAPSLRHR